MAVDLRSGPPKTLIVTAFAGVGLPADYGVAWFLERSVGLVRSRELMMLDRRVDAEQCLRWGLITARWPLTS